MPMVESVATRHRKYTRNLLIPLFRRVSEDGVIKGREVRELEEALDGEVRFVDAEVAITALNTASYRSTDPEHFGDLVSMRDATIALLPDIAA